MRKFILALLFITSTAYAADPTPASVHIIVYEGNVQHHGSGTVVHKDKLALILTNKHVASGPGQILVVWPNGCQAFATHLAVDDQEDLSALVTFPPKDCLACPLADKPANINDPLIQVGYPRAKGPNTLRGTLKEARRARLNTNQGDSGSGVFNEDGRLVAIVWGGNALRDANDVTYAAGEWGNQGQLIAVKPISEVHAAVVPHEGILRFLTNIGGRFYALQGKQR
jgi:S1-C subfamily serine protease